MTKHSRDLILVLTLALLLPALGSALAAESGAPQGQPAFKGMELYSWRGEDGGWRFALVEGTNRIKSAQEIKAPPEIEGIGGVKRRLAKLPAREQVSWLHHSEGFEYPSVAIVREIVEFAQTRQIEVHLPEALRGGVFASPAGEGAFPGHPGAERRQPPPPAPPPAFRQDPVESPEASIQSAGA